PPDVNAIRAALTDAVSAVNAANDSDTGVTLAYGQLLDAVPLPNHVSQAVPIPAGGPLPTEDDVTPYAVTFVLTLESGLSQILDDHSDSYALTPYERLSLGGVEAAVAQIRGTARPAAAALPAGCRRDGRAAAAARS